jgi:hypothetical protein
MVPGSPLFPLHPLDEPPFCEPLDEPTPPLLDVLPPAEHALSHAPHAKAPASPWLETQVDSWSFDPHVGDCAFGALKSPPGQMQPR